MDRKITLLLLMVFILWGCSKKEPLLINGESFTEKDLDMCRQDLCPEITINYVEAMGDDAVSEKINNKIQNYIIASLLLGEDTIPTAKTINEAAIGFIKTFRSDKKQFPDMAGDYFAEINVSELYNSEEIICLEMRQYLYSGGAHGYGSTAFVNLDPETGDEITNKNLFSDEEKFKSFAEKEFRKQNDIPINESINSTGFWFENEKFSLPESLGITKDSLIFVFNQYDIASYAEGPVEFKISKQVAEPFLKIK